MFRIPRNGIRGCNTACSNKMVITVQGSGTCFLSSWLPIKLYFIQQGEEEINKVLWNFVQHQEG
jgi:hypothetical protein